jgi:hypothetical protein
VGAPVNDWEEVFFFFFFNFLLTEQVSQNFWTRRVFIFFLKKGRRLGRFQSSVKGTSKPFRRLGGVGEQASLEKIENMSNDGSEDLGRR